MGSRRYVAAAYVVAYYPPAPLVEATAASGARLTDMPESAMVRSLVRPRLGFGVGRKARYGTMHRCRHAVVSCMEEVAFLLHVRCTEHVACYMMHAACCCMMHRVRKANGSTWCGEGPNRTEFPCGFSSTAAVRRTCRTLTLMVLPHLPAIVQLHRQVSSTRPSPHLRRVRILPLGLRRAPLAASAPGTLPIAAPKGPGPDPSHLPAPGPGPQSLSPHLCPDHKPPNPAPSLGPGTQSAPILCL